LILKNQWIRELKVSILLSRAGSSRGSPSVAATVAPKFDAVPVFVRRFFHVFFRMTQKKININSQCKFVFIFSPNLPKPAGCRCLPLIGKLTLIDTKRNFQTSWKGPKGRGSSSSTTPPALVIFT
jgi:hypothetical protein